MNKKSRQGHATLAAFALCAVSVLLADAAVAQPAFPSKTIRILVGAPAGGSNDIFARAIGQRLNEAWGQPVVVENRPGANQMIAAEVMSKSAADGHTLYVTSSTYTTAVAVMPKLPFDPVGDVAGITMLGKGPMVLVVHPALPAKNVKELVAIARARPGELNYTSSGTGSINQLGIEVLQSMTKIKMTHVPHKGMAPAITDLMGGHVQVLLVSLPSVHAQMNSGRLRALGVSSPKRSSFVPELPAISETVPGYDNELWWGIFAPAKTARPVVDKLNQEIHRVLATEDMKKRFADFGAEPSPTTPEGFGGIVKSEIAKWKKVVQDAHIKAE